MKNKFIMFAMISFIATFCFAGNLEGNYHKYFHVPNVQNKITVFGKEVHFLKTQETDADIEPAHFPGQHAFCQDLCSRGAVDPTWGDYIRCYLACMSIK